MDDQPLDPLSQVNPDAVENKTESTDKPNIILVESLRATTGLSGVPLETAVNEFLSGEGELHETTRAAITRGGSSSVSEIAAFLTDKFKLSSTVATLVATLLVKLFPSIKKLTGKKTAAKKKPRRKAKAKTKPAAKKKAASSKKKAKKKTTAKPKTTAQKSAAKKKKTTAQAAKKKAKSTAKPKKAKRTTTVEGT